jgi:hypothetical protein
MRLPVGRKPAELKNVFVMTEPYPPLGGPLKVEATVLGLQQSEGLDLEFCAESPSGQFQELAKIETKRLSPGEKVQYSAEITPKEEGLYTVTACLYDNFERVGRETDYVYVQK